MMNFRKSMRKSGKRTSSSHGFSWQQRKQYKNNTDKIFFERPSDAYVSSQTFISIEVAVQELGGEGGVGQKHLERARVNISLF